MTLGAYYQWNQNQAIGLGPDGLGQTPDSGFGFAEETLQQELREKGVQPVATVAQWAQQKGDVAWQDLGPPGASVVLLPISDAIVRSVEANAYGHPLGWVAVLTRSPVTPGRAEASFAGSAYGFTDGYGVYREDDTQTIPTIYFLYWSQVRDPSDKQGGRKSLDAVAQALGGKLVAPIQIARAPNARPHPGIAFRHAFDAQTMPGGPAAPLPGATAPAPTATARSAGVPWWGWALVAAAGYGAYRWWKGREEPSR